MKEISKTTIAVLLVLTILVSAIGTWSVLESVSNTSIRRAQLEGNTHAKISLTVQEPPTEPAGQSQIKLNVQKPE